MTMQFQQQQQTFTPIDNPVLLVEETALEVPDFESYDSGLIDVRAFNSFYFWAEVTPDAGNPNSQWTNDIEFYAQPVTGSSNIVFEDEYTLFQSNVNDFRLTDQMHGGWIRFFIFDTNSAPFPMTLDLKFFGSYRQMPNAYLRNAEDGVLFSRSYTGAAGTNDGGHMATLGYGETQVALWGELDAAQIEIYVGGTGASSLVYKFNTAVAGERGTWRIMLPKIQAWVKLTNSGAVNNTVRARIYAPPQPY